MSKSLLVVGFLMLWATATAAIAVTVSDTAIREVISQQLNAINNDDGQAAFAIASPNIQTMFGSPATFMSMVERGYPQIYRSRSHRFLNIDDSSGTLQQRVLVEGETGSVIVRYEMIEIDGRWRINGCRIEKVEDV